VSAAKKASVRARGLVLVRGGLKAQDGGGEDDWEDFCRRIGWQTGAPSVSMGPQAAPNPGALRAPSVSMGPQAAPNPGALRAPEPSEDFEERIRRGLFAKAAEINDVIDLDLQRQIRRSLVRDFGSLPQNEAPISGVHEIDPAALREFRAACLADAPGNEGVSDPDKALSDIDASVLGEAAEAGPALDIDSGRRRLGWERVGVATLTLALAAAVLLAVMKLAVFSSSTPSNGGLSAGIERDAISGPRAAPSRMDAPLPEVVAPVRTAPPQGPTATPAPPPKVPRDAKPVPPGAVVARRARKDVRETPDVATDPVETNSDVVEPAGYTLASSAGSPSAWPAVASDAVPAAPWGAAYRPRSAGDSLFDVAPSTPRVAALDNIASPSHASADVLLSTPPSADSAALDRTPAPGASLGLTGASNRWIGASLPPSPPAFASANIGVMVQLDLGRAFNDL